MDSDLLKAVDLAEASKAETVVCVRVPKPAEAAAAPATAKTLLPQARLKAADLWAAYEVKEADTFVVADKFGNESRRAVGAKGTALAGYVKDVAKSFRTARAKMKTEVANAEKAAAEGNTDAALAALRKVFAQNLVGYEESEKAAAIYGDLLAKGREALKGAKDVAALDALATQWAGTELETEVATAKASLSGKN